MFAVGSLVYLNVRYGRIAVVTVRVTLLSFNSVPLNTLPVPCLMFAAQDHWLLFLTLPHLTSPNFLHLCNYPPTPPTISYNSLAGSLPATGEDWSPLTALTTLSVAHSSLAGTVPAYFTDLSRLQVRKLHCRCHCRCTATAAVLSDYVTV